MVAKRTIKGQLESLGLHFRFFGRREARELRHLIAPNELIYQCARGYYHGGSGILVVTNLRVMLIDKRSLYLNLEEFSYDSIINVEVLSNFLVSTLVLETASNKLIFKSISDARIDEISKIISFICRTTEQDNTKDLQRLEYNPHKYGSALA